MHLSSFCPTSQGGNQEEKDCVGTLLKHLQSVSSYLLHLQLPASPAQPAVVLSGLPWQSCPVRNEK